MSDPASFMQRPILFLLVFCILLGFAIIGYTQWLTPTPPPPTAMPPMATSQPTATITAEAAIRLTTDHLDLPPFTLSFGTAWPALLPTDRGWSTKLQQLAAKKPMLYRYWTALATMSVSETRLALIWPAEATTDLLLVAAITSAEDLTLLSYLTAAKEELAQSRLLLGAAVTVSSAEVRYDLRQDHMPVATLRYTLPANAHDNVGTGYQVAMIDKTGTHLLLLTAITHDADPTKALSLVNNLVATIQAE